MIKLRAMSYKQDNERLALILSELQRINAIKIIEQSKPYSNKGNSIQERVYYDIEINPNIVNTPKMIEQTNIIDKLSELIEYVKMLKICALEVETMRVLQEVLDKINILYGGKNENISI